MKKIEERLISLPGVPTGGGWVCLRRFPATGTRFSGCLFAYRIRGGYYIPVVHCKHVQRTAHNGNGRFLHMQTETARISGKCPEILHFAPLGQVSDPLAAPIIAGVSYPLRVLCRSFAALSSPLSDPYRFGLAYSLIALLAYSLLRGYPVIFPFSDIWCIFVLLFVFHRLLL